MKTRVIVLTIAAAFSVSGLARAVEVAVNGVAQPVQAMEQAKPALVVVGNKTCPVCGMEIPAADMGKNTVEYKGKVFNVCSAADKDAFLADAEKYSKIAEESTEGVKEEVGEMKENMAAEGAEETVPVAVTAPEAAAAPEAPVVEKK